MVFQLAVLQSAADFEHTLACAEQICSIASTFVIGVVSCLLLAPSESEVQTLYSHVCCSYLIQQHRHAHVSR